MVIKATQSLLGKVIAVPENRQLDQLAELLEVRSATVRRVPLISIHDSVQTEQILSWMQAFIKQPPDLFIIFTGEGVRRLLAFAKRNGLLKPFTEVLASVEKLCRGPKPNLALREINLTGDIQALEPTTDGIILSLEKLPLENKRVAVQLYGEEPNDKLMTYLRARLVTVAPVAPYIYANQTEQSQVVELIVAANKGEIDVFAFTSQAQFKRLLQVAKTQNLMETLFSGMSKVRVAAVGPMVKAQLEEAGVEVDIMPERAFFMKPLVAAIMKDLA